VPSSPILDRAVSRISRPSPRSGPPATGSCCIQERIEEGADDYQRRVQLLCGIQERTPGFGRIAQLPQRPIRHVEGRRQRQPPPVELRSQRRRLCIRVHRSSANDGHQINQIAKPRRWPTILAVELRSPPPCRRHGPPADKPGSHVVRPRGSPRVPTVAHPRAARSSEYPTPRGRRGTRPSSSLR